MHLQNFSHYILQYRTHQMLAEAVIIPLFRTAELNRRLPNHQTVQTQTDICTHCMVFL